MRDEQVDWNEVYGGPSRSQQRREALEVLALAQAISELSEREIGQLPLSADLCQQALETKRIGAQIAHKRQVQFFAKQLRKHEEELPTIRAALEISRQSAQRTTAQLHHAEAWRERLIAEGDPALDSLLGEHPQADRQQLRSLLRRAQAEAAAERPPAAARQLFRLLRELLE
ncbi:MAG: ribosome biogenesis factor YjgA [Lysobacterales bacterium]